MTIPSGCLAERTHLYAYPVYTLVLSMVVHPLVAHWAWSGGWLTSVASAHGCQFLDFAGGAVVHLVGTLLLLQSVRKNVAVCPKKNQVRCRRGRQLCILLCVEGEGKGASVENIVLGIDPAAVAILHLKKHHGGLHAQGLYESQLLCMQVA